MALKSKYYAALDEEILAAALNEPAEFAINQMRAGFFDRMKSAGIRWAMPKLFRLARKSPFSVFSLFGLKYVTRAVDVKAILENHKDFCVPFGPEMKALTGGVTFALGSDDEEHARQREIMEMIYEREDLAVVAEIVDVAARGLLEDSCGCIDVLEDYMLPVLTEACLGLFGIYADDPKSFAHWNLAVSNLIFADPYGNEETRKTAFAAARNLNAVIDKSIEKWERLVSKGATYNRTLLERLVVLSQSEIELNDGTKCKDFLTRDRIRAMMVGMISGNIPTVLISAGNLLEVLIKKRSKWLKPLTAAALKDEEGKTKVSEIIMEAARFQPGVFPGQARYVNRDVVLGEPGTSKHRFKKGDVLFVATTSAVVDAKARANPYAFKPGHPAKPDYMFGYGIHDCIGKWLAIEIMTVAFQALFRLDELKPRSRFSGIKRLGPFPYNFVMTFKPENCSQGQTMLTISIPLADKAVAENVRHMLEERYQNPAAPQVAKAFEATGLVHSASMLVADLTEKEQLRHKLILEINGDGTQQEILNAVGQHVSEVLEPLLERCGKPTPQSTKDFLGKHVAKMRIRPWGGMALLFNGIGEFSVKQIQQEKEFYEFARDISDPFVGGHGQHGNFAKIIVREIRMYLRDDPEIHWRIEHNRKNGNEEEAKRFEDQLRRAKKFRHLLYRPSAKKLQFAARPQVSFSQAIIRYLRSPKALMIYGVLAIILVSFAARRTYQVATIVDNDAWLTGLATFLSSFISLLFGILGVAIAVFAIGLFLFRRAEKKDHVDNRYPSADHIAEIEAQEDRPGFEQNQITAVNTLKPGFLRKVALAAAFHSIKAEVLYWFRPGFVVDIGTIRHAKWFRLPGSDQMIFQANYDGSWESYLEDFSNKAYQGQNAAWSNCEGFPKTNYLMFDGAKDGDRFKRWVRRRQVLTGFWYSRFPKMTNTQIRINALIRDGVARLKTDSEARAWLSYFGSRPRPSESIETEEVQSLVFHGMKNLGHSACIAIGFKDAGDNVEERREFLRDYKGKVGYGDKIHPGPVFFLGLSSSGLVKLGLPDDSDIDGLSSFPPAFVQGMRRRSAILGDVERNDPENWDWSDTADKKRQRAGVDMVIIVMAPGKTILEEQLKKVRSDFANVANELQCIECGFLPKEIEAQASGSETGDHSVEKAGGNPAPTKDPGLEPFGFQDAISQPIMKGTHRYAQGAELHDTVEPGEFILGYPDNKQVFPPSPSVHRRHDPKNELPDPPDALTELFADFSASRTPLGDFGRNGTFIVIRQLEQNVEGFWKQAKNKAIELNNNAATPEPVDGEWIAARMIGRWKSGHPLVRYPSRPAPEKGNSTENDFLFGRDDAPGFRCPHGAHIRRANPRESFAPNQPEQIEISNRHRIIRRGRPYTETLTDGKAGRSGRGLLFICFNSNIERQFEFIQQTWSNAKSFHGLRLEADPLLNPTKKTQFTVPTPNGPINIDGIESYVTMKGGGYFFMPSRSALDFIAPGVPGPAGSIHGG
ncbi:cytochrome P450 [Hoeflea sp. TYP-13]|uniref:cytochrome P450 n=1 Tax=Hoeflea sp. TYP-13 TaxID=3230023 RepID=UPI0034C688ED